MLLVETPSRAATSETGYPCSLICFTASILNSSVKFLADINTPSLSLHYEAKKCLRNPGLFKHCKNALIFSTPLSTNDADSTMSSNVRSSLIAPGLHDSYLLHACI